MTYNILFVCLGNICRSVTAQTIMQHLVDKAGLTAHYTIDSAGIIDYHEGELADQRMRNHAAKRGYRITHRSRPVTPHDFERFNLIIGMDRRNILDLQSIAPSGGRGNQIRRMTDFCLRYKDITEVPDPYYGGPDGFEYVLDVLEDACEGLLEQLQTRS